MKQKINEYDQLKKFLDASRRIFAEQDFVGDETNNQQPPLDEQEKEKYKKYIVSGAVIRVMGIDDSELELKSSEEEAFKESMEDFINDITDMVEFKTLNISSNNIEWNGTLLQEKIDFVFSLEDSQGIYITTNLLQLRDDTMETLNSLQEYYKKWVSKWGRILSERKVEKRQRAS